jgi:hypothetical protein
LEIRCSEGVDLHVRGGVVKPHVSRFAGPWKPPQIDNPDYQGEWVHPQIDNPEYESDDELYKFEDFGTLGFDLWQVRLGGWTRMLTDVLGVGLELLVL